MPSFQVLVLGFLFVSFRPSSLRSHSCSTSACLPLSPSACPLPIRFLSPASLPVLTTQPSASSFLPSGPLASQSALRPGFGSLRPRPFSPSSTAGFPSASFRFRILSFLFVSFRPSLLRFPQLFHRCSPVALTQAFSLVSAAFRLTSTLGFGYSAFRSSFSDFPVLPRGGFSGTSVSAFASPAPPSVLPGFP